MKAEVGIIASEAVLPRESLGSTEDVKPTTPFGSASSPVTLGTFGGKPVAVLRRHGVGRSIPPHAVNHRANIALLKDVKVEGILAANSVGSLDPELRPGTLVVPDDFVSFWDVPTFYDDEVVHATPLISPALLRAAKEAASQVDFSVTVGGVYVQTKGPRLETRAEVSILRDYGDVVGMTMASEATLAAEAGLEYLSVCSVDNYCHGVVEEVIDWETIRDAQGLNAERVRAFLRAVLEALG
jgi:5'-methylthioadenosine phosphorylase